MFSYKSEDMCEMQNTISCSDIARVLMLGKMRPWIFWV